MCIVLHSNYLTEICTNILSYYICGCNYKIKIFLVELMRTFFAKITKHFNGNILQTQFHQIRIENSAKLFNFDDGNTENTITSLNGNKIKCFFAVWQHIT